MFGTLFRLISHLVYHYTPISEDRQGSGPFGTLKVATVADAFTALCLSQECRIRCLTPGNYKDVLTSWKPDLVFVESVFHGVHGEWRYLVGNHPWYFNLQGNRIIRDLVQYARDRHIPTLFWNKDDGAFFDFFLDVARLFPHVCTTDNTCVPKYRAALPAETSVDVLPMPYQPAFHSFTGFHFVRNEACFVGSYYRRILNARKLYLDRLFAACHSAGLPVHVYDRNSKRLSHRLDFCYPKDAHLILHDAVPHTKTGDIYKHYAVSLNVNSVTTSETMYSRRLLEILACGGILLTNTSPVVEHEFKDYCHILSDPKEDLALLARLAKDGPSREDKDRAEAGAAYVRAHHTWQHRLEQIAQIIPL